MFLLSVDLRDQGLDLVLPGLLGPEVVLKLFKLGFSLNSLIKKGFYLIKMNFE